MGVMATSSGYACAKQSRVLLPVCLAYILAMSLNHCVNERMPVTASFPVFVGAALLLVMCRLKSRLLKVGVSVR